MSASSAAGPAFRTKLALARATGSLSRRSGRGGGTTLPGRVLLRLAPDAVSRLGSELTDGTTIVSATMRPPSCATSRIGARYGNASGSTSANTVCTITRTINA